MINEIKENTYRIKSGSYYWIQTYNSLPGEEWARNDDFFQNDTFSEDEIQIDPNEPDRVLLNIESGFLITDKSNLVRVV